MENNFSREDTKIIKGIAIILMLMHHLWSFPDRISGGEFRYFISIFGQSSISYLGAFGKICVPIFFFLGGYGIYKACEKKPFDLISKIKGLYISYWKVFLIFVPIGFIMFSNQPIYCKSEYICTRYSNFSTKEFINNFLCLNNSYNGEWWFLRSYIYAIITYPVIEKIINKFSKTTNICLIIIGSILITNFFPALGEIETLGYLNNNYLYRIFLGQSSPFIACFWIGCLMAKENSLLKLKILLKNNNLLSPILDFIFIAIIIFMRNSGIGDTLDIIYVPFLIIFCIDLLQYFKKIKTFLLYIGKESTNMWLIHSFYCYYFYPIVKIVVNQNYAILSLFILIAITYISSLTITKFWDKLYTTYNKIIPCSKSLQEH